MTAAMAADCEPCLNMLVPRLIEAGVSGEDIKTAVSIGKETQDKICDTTWAAAAAALGIQSSLGVRGCGCGADTGTPAEGKTSCCG